VSRDPAFREAFVLAEAQGDWGQLREQLSSGQFNTGSDGAGLAAALGSFVADPNAPYNSADMPDDFAAVFDDLDSEHVYLPFSRRASAMSTTSMNSLMPFDAVRRTSAMSNTSMSGMMSMDVMRRASAMSLSKQMVAAAAAGNGFEPLGPAPDIKAEKKAPASAPNASRLPKPKRHAKKVKSEQRPSGAVYPHVTGMNNSVRQKNPAASVGVVAVSPWPAQSQGLKKQKGNALPQPTIPDDGPCVLATTPEQAKLRKNERERKRRLAVSQGFDQLLKLLDMPTANKMDKACVLHTAITRICELEQRAEALQANNQSIRRELGLPAAAPLRVRIAPSRRDSAHLHAAAAVAAAVAMSQVKPH
jgi:hypothetical protein